MSGIFRCSICGKEYDNLALYFDCVSSCYEKAQKAEELEAQRKRMEEINAYIKDIKSLRQELEKLETEFCMKYPKEYELNFGEVTYNEAACGDDCNECPHCESCEDSECACTDSLNDLLKSIEVSFVNNGKDKKVDAKINGKKVDNDILKEIAKDPEIGFLVKMLGI